MAEVAREWFGLTVRNLEEAMAFVDRLRAAGHEARCYANGEVIAKLPTADLCLEYLEFVTEGTR